MVTEIKSNAGLVWKKDTESRTTKVYKGHWCVGDYTGDNLVFWLLTILKDLRERGKDSEFWGWIKQHGDDIEMSMDDDKYHLIGISEKSLTCLRCGEPWRDLMLDTNITDLVVEISALYEKLVGGAEVAN